MSLQTNAEYAFLSFQDTLHAISKDGYWTHLETRHVSDDYPDGLKISFKGENAENHCPMLVDLFFDDAQMITNYWHCYQLVLKIDSYVFKVEHLEDKTSEMVTQELLAQIPKELIEDM